MNSSEKINLSILIPYVICCVLLIMHLFLSFFTIGINNIFGEIILTLIALTPLALFYISYLVLIIFWIINFIKNKNKSFRKKLIIMLSILSLGAIIFQIVPSTLKIIVKNNTILKINESLSRVVDKIESDDKYVYFLKDIQSLDENFKKSIYGDTYLASSYITNYNDKIYVCLTDGTNIIKGYIDDLKISDLDLGCKYKFSLEEEELYLKKYLEDKYDFRIMDVECTKENISFYLYNECSAHTEEGDFYINANINNNEIIVSDEYENMIANESEKLVKSITKFTKDYLQTEDLSKSDYFNISIFDISKEDIVIDTYANKESAKIYAEALANYLLENNYAINIKIVKFDKNANSEGKTIIGFSVKDNQIIWN